MKISSCNAGSWLKWTECPHLTAEQRANCYRHQVPHFSHDSLTKTWPSLVITRFAFIVTKSLFAGFSVNSLLPNQENRSRMYFLYFLYFCPRFLNQIKQILRLILSSLLSNLQQMPLNEMPVSRIAEMFFCIFTIVHHFILAALCMCNSKKSWREEGRHQPPPHTALCICVPGL